MSYEDEPLIPPYQIQHDLDQPHVPPQSEWQRIYPPSPLPHTPAPGLGRDTVLERHPIPPPTSKRIPR